MVKSWNVWHTGIYKIFTVNRYVGCEIVCMCVFCCVPWIFGIHFFQLFFFVCWWLFLLWSILWYTVIRSHRYVRLCNAHARIHIYTHTLTVFLKNLIFWVLLYISFHWNASNRMLHRGFWLAFLWVCVCVCTRCKI